MSKKITTTLVKHLADLVKLELTEVEIKQFAKEMANTIDYIHNLNELDTKNIEPTFQTTGLENRFLNEKVNERALNKQEVFQNTTKHKKGYFQIKPLQYSK